MSARQPIYVTQPELPPLDEFLPYLQQIWDSRVLTNGGPFHRQLEAALCEFLGVKHISLFANATIGLVTALQALRIGGEVITTPYSFVATAHSLLWNGIKPVFVDIDPRTLNLDATKIEAATTPQTTAIMPVHCYCHPCDTDRICAIDAAIDKRRAIDARYRAGLAGVEGIACLGDAGERVANHSYFPILVQPAYRQSRDALYQRLRESEIYARRYFYPLITVFPMYRG